LHRKARKTVPLGGRCPAAFKRISTLIVSTISVEMRDKTKV